MFSKASSAALSAFVLLQQLSSASAQSSSATYSADLSTSTACPGPGGAHIIVARGSLETPPYGVQVATKDKILAQIPGSNADGTIGYPNTLQDYTGSATAGAIIARGLITDYVSRCPGLPLVLMGYSQGAQVLGDALLGQDEQAFPPNSSVSGPLPDSTFAQVAALVFYGDPTFVVSETFLVGTAQKNGSFPRRNAALFDTAGLSSRAQTYCDEGDLFCAGGDSIVIHATYLPRVSDSVVSFVVGKVAAWYSANPSTGGMASASATVKPHSASASASASAYASKISACQSAVSGTAKGSGVAPTASVSASRITQSATPSSTVSPSGAVSTGAASKLSMTAVAGAGAVVAGLFAALL